ncbi:hypothetical protein D3C79_932270 [compost metagenome]
MVARVDLAGIVRCAENQLQVGQIDLVFDNPVEQAFFIEEMLVTVVVGDWLSFPQALRHGCEPGGITFGLAGPAPSPCIVNGMVGVLRAMAMGRPAVAGHVLISSPEPAGRIDPAGNGLNTGGFRGLVHHDHFLLHGRTSGLSLSI